MWKNRTEEIEPGDYVHARVDTHSTFLGVVIEVTRNGLKLQNVNPKNTSKTVTLDCQRSGATVWKDAQIPPERKLYVSMFRQQLEQVLVAK
jgi:hypothetical protein